MRNESICSPGIPRPEGLGDTGGRRKADIENYKLDNEGKVKMNITTLLAIWGSVVSTILALIKIIEFRRDRANVKVTVRGGYKIIPINHPENPYGDKYLISITAANKGRRPVTLEQAGLLLPRWKEGRYAIANESLKYIELLEGKSHDYHIIENDVKKEGLTPKNYVAYVRDATGRCFWSHNFLCRLIKLRRIS